MEIKRWMILVPIFLIILVLIIVISIHFTSTENSRTTASTTPTTSLPAASTTPTTSLPAYRPSLPARSGNECSLDITKGALKYPPILADLEGQLLMPKAHGKTRTIPLSHGEVVQAACPGSNFENTKNGIVIARCRNGSAVEVSTPDMQGEARLAWKDMSCKSQPRDAVEVIGPCGSRRDSTLISIGFKISDKITTPAFTVCYNGKTAITLWAKHTLWDEISSQDHGNDRPRFEKDSFYNFDVEKSYSKNGQREAIAKLVGSQELANTYVKNRGNVFLSRGHLAPNADFLFYSFQDSTFHFVNAAPQWQTFNSMNWNSLESVVRKFVISRAFDAEIYTGTHGVLQLPDITGKMVDIYLYAGNRLPVPKFFWKVIINTQEGSGVAVVGVNNPHLKSLPEDYFLCPSLYKPTILSGLKEPENISKGYMYACRVEELSKIVEVPFLPKLKLLN